MILNARNIFRNTYRKFWWKAKSERVPTVGEKLRSQMYYLIPFTICLYNFVSWAEFERIKDENFDEVDAPQDPVLLLENKPYINYQQPNFMPFTTKIPNKVNEEPKVGIPDPRIVTDPNYMVHIPNAETPKQGSVVNDYAHQQAVFDLRQHHTEQAHAHQQAVNDFYQHHHTEHGHHHTEHGYHHTQQDHHHTKQDHNYMDPDYDPEHDHHIHL